MDVRSLTTSQNPISCNVDKYVASSVSKVTKQIKKTIKKKRKREKGRSLSLGEIWRGKKNQIDESANKFRKQEGEIAIRTDKINRLK